MGILDRFMGGEEPKKPVPGTAGAASADEQALERYRYLLRTAPPEAIEQAHAEAFAQLTPDQQAQALQELNRELPEGERIASPTQANPQQLARMATRAELRQPGSMERIFGGSRRGMGGMFGGTLLSSIAGSFIGTAIAHQLLGGFGDRSEPSEHAEADSARDETTDEGHEEFSDTGGDDFGGGFGDD